MSLLLILVLCVVALIAVPVFLTLGIAVWLVKLVLQIVFLPVTLAIAAVRPRRYYRPVWRL
ncbi:MAG: hypothetical protein JO111_10115 [Caulobacteraceae bacterium]|nr:hypothetical protein [Caulobacteraceae bacterium]